MAEANQAREIFSLRLLQKFTSIPRFLYTGAVFLFL